MKLLLRGRSTRRLLLLPLPLPLLLPRLLLLLPTPPLFQLLKSAQDFSTMTSTKASLETNQQSMTPYQQPIIAFRAFFCLRTAASALFSAKVPCT